MHPPGSPALRALVPLCALALLAVACGGASGGEQLDDSGTAGDDSGAAGDDSGDEAGDEAASLTIVANVAPIADLVEMVGGGHVEVSTLAPEGADSHTYEPRPSDVATLADADAFVGIGRGLNPAAASLARDNLPEDAVVLLGERYLTEAELVHDHTHDDAGHTHGDDGHSHDDGGHTHGDDGHSHDGEAGPNPHVWTSLELAASLVDGIGATLGELDPDHADDYRDGATRTRTRIEALDEEVHTATATIPDQNRTLVVYHDAWSYFARDYGLEMVTAVQPSDYSEPSAGEVRDIIELIREHEVPALFGSEVFPNDVLETISEEAGAAYVGDLADDVLPGAQGDPEHSYLGLMRRNAALIVGHLGGDADALREGVPAG